jgi:UDP-N-acetylmuramate--alanine ligase
MAARAKERRAKDRVVVRTYGASTAGVDTEVRIDPDGSATFVPGPTGAVTLGLQVPGRHNVLNAAAAWTAAVSLRFPADRVAEGLEGVTGTRRRFETRGVTNGVAVVDDYAHHPTEVAAVLRAARDVVAGGRVLAVFQPHLYSRTRIFGAEFGAALGLADEVVVMDVYAAREDPEPGVSGALVAAAVPLPAGRVANVPSWSAVAAEAAGRPRPGDLVLTIGAGDVTMLAPEILTELAARGPAPAAPGAAVGDAAAATDAVP